jgi:hypothetical protein
MTEHYKNTFINRIDMKISVSLEREFVFEKYKKIAPD